MTAEFIQDVIQMLSFSTWYGVYVPEFTYENMRIDAAIIETRKRWIRGFEIKVSRADFLRDEKWQNYSEFTSSLTLICPEGLIAPEEIPKPFGLAWVDELKGVTWKKRPKRFQRRDCYAWTLQYTSVIEKELPRLMHEIREMRICLKGYEQPKIAETVL